jgi:hypothetical protein
MRRTSLLPLQDSLLERLSQDMGLNSKNIPVYDHVLDSAGYPRITLGEDTVKDWSTKLDYGEEITHTLHVWSQYKGKKEVKEIMNLILESLTEPLSLDSGFFVEFSKLDFMEVINDSDGLTKHGIIRLRFKISQ